MSQARLREALTAGGPTTKDKGPPVADGILSVTPDTPEVVEWRSNRSVIDSIATCSTYLDDEEEGAPRPGAPGRLLLWGRAAEEAQRPADADAPCRRRRAGPQPSELYGKFTWRIEKFSEVSKRELRSNTFEVGTYKWCARLPASSARERAACLRTGRPPRQPDNHPARQPASSAAVGRARAGAPPSSPLSCRRYILVYPQGCDVANHLSLFLCVADYDKLLPGAARAQGAVASRAAGSRACGSRGRLASGAAAAGACILSAPPPAPPPLPRPYPQGGATLLSSR